MNSFIKHSLLGHRDFMLLQIKVTSWQTEVQLHLQHCIFLFLNEVFVNHDVHNVYKKKIQMLLFGYVLSVVKSDYPS